jgi:hypothetical protein
MGIQDEEELREAEPHLCYELGFGQATGLSV